MSPMTPKATVSELRQRIIDRCAPGNSSRRTDLKKLLDAYREAAVMAERERCAKVCEQPKFGADGMWCAEVIRTDPPGTVRGESE